MVVGHKPFLAAISLNGKDMAEGVRPVLAAHFSTKMLPQIILCMMPFSEDPERPKH